MDNFVWFAEKWYKYMADVILDNFYKYAMSDPQLEEEYKNDLKLARKDYLNWKKQKETKNEKLDR